MSKPRSDSKLFTLPTEDQLKVFEWLKRSSYKEVKEQVRQTLGISVSVGALHNAWEKWAREELEERVLKSKGLTQEVIRAIGGDLDQLELATQAALQQVAFEMAMNGGDPKTIRSFCDLLLKAKTLDLDRQKLDLKERRLKQAEEAEAVTQDKNLSPEARETRMKEIFGLL